MLRRTALCALSMLLCASPAAAGPRPFVERPFVIVLDAGHGGDNGGCTSADGRVREKALALALAAELAHVLGDRLPHARVIMTRSDDRDIALSDRIALANDLQADLFLSLHANASPARDQTGFETYVLDARASGTIAAHTAQRENDDGFASRTPTRHDASAMIGELAQLAHRDRAARFALAIQRAQAQRFPDRLDRGVRQAPFDVLIGARMPAVLFEAGFLDHPQEGRWLASAAARTAIAEALAAAIVATYREQGRL